MQRDQERARWRFNGWQLDRRTRQLTDPNGVPVALTKGEYALLAAFLAEPQRPLTRANIFYRRPASTRMFLIAAFDDR
jgi:DNA-binding response OmpR family regulator